jgi:hypothetical protein
MALALRYANKQSCSNTIIDKIRFILYLQPIQTAHTDLRLDSVPTALVSKARQHARCSTSSLAGREVLGLLVLTEGDFGGLRFVGEYNAKL